jgi:DNA-binding transcriptional LysR family regulator
MRTRRSAADSAIRALKRKTIHQEGQNGMNRRSDLLPAFPSCPSWLPGEALRPLEGMTVTSRGRRELRAIPEFSHDGNPVSWCRDFMDYDFGDIRAFIQVVEHGGVSIAATRMNVSKSVLSARITRLENELHAKLLHRSTRGVTLTDAGQRFFDRMRDVVARMQQAADEAAGEGDAKLSGSLRITAPMTFGTAYLGPQLFAFMRDHPEIELTLELDDRHVDILSGGYDLGVRIGRITDSSLMARRIATSRRVLCCSPGYAASHPLPKSVEDIAAHECICYGNASIAPYWQFEPIEAGGEPQQIVVRGRTHLNNGESMRDAALAGLGLAALPLFIAAAAIRAGELIVVLPQTPPMPDTIYAVYPQTRYVSRLVRALIDKLVLSFDQGAPWDSHKSA